MAAIDFRRTLALGLNPQGWVNVKDYGATGDGTTDDYAAITAAINATAEGATVYFPPGTYMTGTTILLKPYRTYKGMSGLALRTIIKAKAGITNAVLAAEGWWNNATSCDNPIRVEGIGIDGNAQTNIHGLVVYNFWSRFYDIQISNIAGANACGVLATDKARNGTTITSNSHSENQFVQMRFDAHTARANAFYAESNNGASNQDGHIRESFFSAIGGFAVYLGRGAGWYVQHNHFYGIGYDAINAPRSYGTTITGNYVEDFGVDNLTTGATNGYFSGIAINEQLDGRASVVSNNLVSTNQPSTPGANRYSCYQIGAGTSQTKAMVVCEGNAATWASATPAVNKSEAFHFENKAGGTLYVQFGDNHIQTTQPWSATKNVGSGTNLVESSGGASVYTVAGTTGNFTLDANNGNHQIVTMGGNRQLTAITNGTHGMKLTVEYVQDATGSRLLTHTVNAANGFTFGSDLPQSSSALSTTAARRDLIGYVFNGALNRWMVVSMQRGFNTTT